MRPSVALPTGTATDASGQFDLAAQRARLAAIYADRTRLKQVLCNLIHNSARYTPSGGAIKPGLTVVIVSHDLNLASQYCDRILLLDRGQIVRLGGPDEVIEPEVLESVYRCRVLVDRHPSSGLPRITLPGRLLSGEN